MLGYVCSSHRNRDQPMPQTVRLAHDGITPEMVNGHAIALHGRGAGRGTDDPDTINEAVLAGVQVPMHHQSHAVAPGEATLCSLISCGAEYFNIALPERFSLK